MPLSPLQERVASVLAAVPEIHELGLAGGAALIVSGISERVTKDLDYFATRGETVDTLARDFVDVYRLRAYYTREQLSGLASEKDRGFVAPRVCRGARADGAARPHRVRGR